MANSSHLSGAEYMASIFGTEKDMVNCPFFYKIGACRNGIKCKRLHNKPTFSQTVLLKNLYHNPKVSTIMDAGLSQQYQIKAGEHDQSVSDAEEQMHFDEFFEEIFVEVEDKYGEVEEMNVCDNIGEHMIGNVYIKFRKEEDAEACEKGCNERWFGGEPIYAELSPVTDFREACCRQYEMGECTRGGFCNFMHLKPISYELRRELYNRDHPWREAQVPKAPALPALLKDPTRLGSIITANRTAWTQLAEWKRKVTAARRRRALPLPEPDDTRLPLAYLPLPSSSDSEPDSPRLPRPPSDDDDTSSDRAQTPLPLPDPARLSRLTLWRLKNRDGDGGGGRGGGRGGGWGGGRGGGRGGWGGGRGGGGGWGGGGGGWGGGGGGRGGGWGGGGGDRGGGDRRW